MSATAKNTVKTGEVITKEEQELAEREGRIERAQRNAYYEIGLDLAAIRDAELYKITRVQPVAGRYSFTTFEEYVVERWDTGYEKAKKVIASAEAAQKIGTIVPVLPSRESHVRELLQLETDEDRAAVWQEIVDSEETVKAHVVRAAVERYKAAKEKNWLTLDEWAALEEKDRKLAFMAHNDVTFNKQDNDSIEWAQWSWNPVTGCKHDCPYCYARDIANRFYPQKFEPSIYPPRFSAARNTVVPRQAQTDIAYRNVFACSMADLFGRWVPAEWIERVLQTVADNPQWNFLFLTKFPKRMAEFEIPGNAWMGTTVDLQARVKAAEQAFERVESGVKWLSIEPMLEPIRFSRLDLFDWVVVGGASRSSKTQEWVPSLDMLFRIHEQARMAGCAVYYKSNTKLPPELRLREFPWGIPVEPVIEAPSEFKYLG